MLSTETSPISDGLDSACPKNPCLIPRFVVASRASLRRGPRSRDRIIQSGVWAIFLREVVKRVATKTAGCSGQATVPAPARFLRGGSASLSGAILSVRGLSRTVRSFHLPHSLRRTAGPRLPKSNMAAAAAASCCSAAPPARRRGLVCSYARHSFWRPPPRRAAAAARVSCVYSAGAETITACSWNEYVICSDVPVLVEFWASWCGPCRMVTRLVDEIAQNMLGK